MRTFSSRCLALATVMVAASAAPAQTYLNRIGVPDIDQRWDDIPNDGKYYCAPTSNYNIMRYMDAHGVPNMMNGYTFDAWVDLVVLGIIHGTDPYKGGPARPGFDLILNRIGAREGNPLIFGFIYGPTAEWGINTMKNAMYSRSLGVVAYGRYEFYDLPFLGPGWLRTGGHVTTLTGYDWRNSPRRILVRDPAQDEDPNNLNSQSPNTTKSIAVRNIDLFTHDYGTVTHAVQDPTSDGVRLYDAMYQFMPATGGWQNGAVVIQNSSRGVFKAVPKSNGNGNNKYKGDEIVLKMPFQFEDEGQPDTFTFKPREQAIDWTPDLGNIGAYYITHLGRVFHVDGYSGEHKLLHVIKGAKKVMIGGTRRETYILASDKHGDKIVQLDGRGKVAKSLLLPYRVATMEHDPVTGGPALPSADYTRMALMDEDLNPMGEMDLPGVPEGLGDVIFRIVPGDGSVLLARKGGSGFGRVGRRAATDNQWITLRTTYGIASIAPTGQGSYIIQDGDTLFTIDQAGNRSYSQFDGITGVTGEFRLSRSHVAAKPDFDIQPGWENIETD